MRNKAEIQNRINIVKKANDIIITSFFDEAERATRQMSPSAAFAFTQQMGTGNPFAMSVAKAVRWQRIFERDFHEHV